MSTKEEIKTCPDCQKARKKYDRLDARMASVGNFGIVPLFRSCKKHRIYSRPTSEPKPAGEMK